jgi:4a-hydroxytetrahydrobiopterin dehydratase
MGLAEKECVPCKGGVPPLGHEEIVTLQKELQPEWRVVEDRYLDRVYAFPDFRTALDFVNRVGQIAESEGHHPDLELGWGRVRVQIFTHKIGGLTESDFILAAKIDRLSKS